MGRRDSRERGRVEEKLEDKGRTRRRIMRQGNYTAVSQLHAAYASMTDHLAGSRHTGRQTGSQADRQADGQSGRQSSR